MSVILTRGLTHCYTGVAGWRAGVAGGCGQGGAGANQGGARKGGAGDAGDAGDAGSAHFLAWERGPPGLFRCSSKADFSQLPAGATPSQKHSARFLRCS